MSVGRPPEWPRDRAILDRYIVVATPRYADFSPFESARPSRLTRGGTAESLPPLLRAALGGGRVRGGELEKPAWGIGFCDLEIVTTDQFEKIVGH